jgi:hypothetical protein
MVDSFVGALREALGIAYHPEQGVSVEQDHGLTLTGSTSLGSISFGLPVFEWSDWAYDVSNDLCFAGHVAEDIVGPIFGGDQLHYRLAVLGDHDGLAALQHLIHDGQALRFELACGDLFHSMVIIL